jgi:hypothetical protein
MRALLARTEGDEDAYRQHRNRYRKMATDLDFQGIWSGLRRCRDRRGPLRLRTVDAGLIAALDYALLPEQAGLAARGDAGSV